MDIADVFLPHGLLPLSVALVVEHRNGFLISLRLLCLGEVGIFARTLAFEGDWPPSATLTHLK